MADVVEGIMWATQMHHFSALSNVVYDALEQEQDALVQREGYLFKE